MLSEILCLNWKAVFHWYTLILDNFPITKIRYSRTTSNISKVKVPNNHLLILDWSLTQPIPTRFKDVVEVDWGKSEQH